MPFLNVPLKIIGSALRELRETILFDWNTVKEAVRLAKKFDR